MIGGVSSGGSLTKPKRWWSHVLTDVLTVLLWLVLSLVFMVALVPGRPYAIGIASLGGMPVVLTVLLAALFHALCFRYDGRKRAVSWRYRWLEKLAGFLVALYRWLTKCQVVCGENPEWRRALLVTMYAPAPAGNWIGREIARAGSHCNLMFTVFVAANTASFVAYNAIPLRWYFKLPVCLLAPLLIERMLSLMSPMARRLAAVTHADQLGPFLGRHFLHRELANG